MKKYKKILILLLLLFFTISPSTMAKDDDTASIDERIASVGFGKIFAGDAKKDITNLFKKVDNYALNKNIKKIKEFYSEDFVNNDGFDFDTFFKSAKDSLNGCNYKVIETKIQSISVNDDYAVAHVIENSEGETLKPTDGIEGNGLVLSSSEIYYYLQKKNRKWVITSMSVIDESTSILYGTAKNVYFSLNVPTQVKSGSEYLATLSFAPMKDMLVTASLTAEPIKYPYAKQKEVFKTVKGDGILERYLTANSQNYNEYVVATIGISNPKLIAENFSMNLSGSAFVFRRVNVFNPKIQKNNSAKISNLKYNKDKEVKTESQKDK